MALTAALPVELHSSVHAVRIDGVVLGEYEMRIYRGRHGPVVVVETANRSALPIEYLSAQAVQRFCEALPGTKARFFERHRSSARDVWVEVFAGAGGATERQASSWHEFSGALAAEDE